MAKRNMKATADKAKKNVRMNLRYDIGADEITELMHLATDQPYDLNNVYKALCTAFYYGYALGGRAVAHGDKAV